jgi:hypothetical protein
MAFFIDTDADGGKRVERLGLVGVRPGRLVYLARAGALRSPVEVEVHQWSRAEEYEGELRPYMEAGDRGTWPRPFRLCLPLT